MLDGKDSFFDIVHNIILFLAGAILKAFKDILLILGSHGIDILGREAIDELFIFRESTG